MSNKIERSAIEQKEYKDKLIEESIRIYGETLCYASKLPFKGLIASHIKPYKLCIIENDYQGEFDVNNGLLLSKQLDDYFDKLLISFDDNGFIIFSDTIPEKIKAVFQNYHLGEEVYNEARKRYMQIHRSLFYYKNYYHKLYDNTMDLEMEKLFSVSNNSFYYLKNKDKFIYKNSFTHDAEYILNKANITEESDCARIKEELFSVGKGTSTHFGQQYLNTATLVGMMRMFLKDLALKHGVEFPVGNDDDELSFSFIGFI